jgi:Na+/H+ antiporter NhaA
MVSLTKLFNEFYNSEKAGGLILVFVTIIALVLANLTASVISGVAGFWWLTGSLKEVHPESVTGTTSDMK